MSFGNRLKKLRLESNMTQEDLSKKLNVSRATVGRYENDERFPDKEILKEIADIFSVSIDYLLERTNKQSLCININETLHTKNNMYSEIEDKIIQQLICEGLVNPGESLSKELIENIVKYGIEAAIKIAKLEKKLEE